MGAGYSPCGHREADSTEQQYCTPAAATPAVGETRLCSPYSLSNYNAPLKMEAQQNSLLKPDSSGDLYVCVLVAVRAQAVLCFNVIALSAKGISDPRFHLVEEYFF